MAEIKDARYATLVPYVEDGYTGYQVVVKEAAYDWETGDEDEFGSQIVRFGPYLGDALLPADVQAARWAKEQGLPYRS